jgi:hypothetical protein
MLPELSILTAASGISTVLRNSSSTRVPNLSASTGTRSSMPWNSDGEVQVGRQPQRGEAEAAHAQLCERLGVGAAGEHVRRDVRARVLGRSAAAMASTSGPRTASPPAAGA